MTGCAGAPSDHRAGANDGFGCLRNHKAFAPAASPLPQTHPSLPPQSPTLTLTTPIQFYTQSPITFLLISLPIHSFTPRPPPFLLFPYHLNPNSFGQLCSPFFPLIPLSLKTHLPFYSRYTSFSPRSDLDSQLFNSLSTLATRRRQAPKSQRQ